jgi:hypothetical protein
MAKPLRKIMQYIAQHGIVRPREIEAIPTKLERRFDTDGTLQAYVVVMLDVSLE